MAAELRLYWICDGCRLQVSTFALSSDDRDERAARLVEAHAIARPDCPGEPRLLDAVPTVDSKTGIKPISAWGYGCARGFVSDARFGSGQVIKRTNRDVSRRWRRGGSS
jgi:hypothetical protein